MKKIKNFLLLLLCVGCIGIVGGAYILKSATRAETLFLKTFNLDIEVKKIRAEEKYNSYGFHGDGVAMYTITFSNDCSEFFKTWNPLPMASNAKEFLESVKTYVELPEITTGSWKMVDRSPIGENLSNVSLCVYNKDMNIAYFITLDT